MPTFKDKRTGTRTIAGLNSPIARLAARRPDRYQLVENTQEPATADEQQVQAMAEQAKTSKQTKSTE